jgi:hypothetical protein
MRTPTFYMLWQIIKNSGVGSRMVKLYESTNGIIHLVQAGYICIHAIGKVKSNLEGDGSIITCKNCKLKVAMYE